MEEKPPNGKPQNINRAFFESYDQVHIQMPEHGLDFKCYWSRTPPAFFG